MPNRALIPVLLFCILAVTIACYLPGLEGHFVLDDAANIGKNPQLKMERLDFSALWHAAASGGAAGPLQRPISMASFALNRYFSGMDAYYFKLTNLGIHLVNGVLVFLLVRLLLGLYRRVHGVTLEGEAWMALAVSAMWLLHPFNLTGVLYVVQRMTSLAALFTLAGLVLYLYGRKRLLDGRNSGFVAIGAATLVATPLAAFSKETGALLPLFILVVEATLLRWNVPDRNSRRMLVAVVGLSAAAPLLFGLYYVLHNFGQILAGYSVRDFSLTERLMTEARVLWFYLYMIVLPNLTEMGLHHDDILVSRSLLSPWTTLPAVIGLLLLVVGAFALRNKQPILSFGIAFFLAGHALESTVIPLEIAFEHRNYLPMFGILLPMAYYALCSRLHLPSLRWRKWAFVAMLVMFAGLTASRGQQWGNTFLMRMLEVERHPHSVRANTDMAALYDHMPPTSQEDAINLYNKALFHYQQAAESAPSSVAGLVGLLAVTAERGLQPDPVVIELLENRLATVPLGPPNVNTLIGLTRAVADGEFWVSRAVVERLYRAVLSNPTLTTAHRNSLIFEFGNLPPEIRPLNSVMK